MDVNSLQHFGEFGESSFGSPYKKKTRLSEESHFLRLFGEVLDIVQQTMNVGPDEFETALATIRDSFRYEKGNRFSDIDFNKTENLYAYFYRVSPLSFALTRDRIVDGLENCAEFASKFMAEQVNVVSIGCGPGSDIVGLCSAISRMPFQKIKLTLVDSVKRWSSFFNILELLMREKQFGCASDLFQRVDITTTFLWKDVSDTSEKNSDYFQALREADVILMKDVFSILPFSKMNNIKRTIVKEMKPGALLLYIDSYYYGFHGFEIVYANYDQLQRSPEDDFKMPASDGSFLDDFFSYEQLRNIEDIPGGFQDFSKSQIVILAKQEEHGYF